MKAIVKVFQQRVWDDLNVEEVEIQKQNAYVGVYVMVPIKKGSLFATRTYEHKGEIGFVKVGTELYHVKFYNPKGPIKGEAPVVVLEMNKEGLDNFIKNVM